VVTVNGRVVWEHGHGHGYQAALADGYVQLTVPGGRYTVAAVGR
jgi:hypothetical protein